MGLLFPKLHLETFLNTQVKRSQKKVADFKGEEEFSCCDQPTIDFVPLYVCAMTHN